MGQWQRTPLEKTKFVKNTTKNMKLGKLSLIISAVALTVINAGATTYNTGYSTSTVAGQLVDNLWTVTATSNVPASASLPAVPYSAFVLPDATITWPWDKSAPPAGAQNSDLTQWDSNQQPAFAGGDNVGMVTTYTLNFNAVAGAYTLYFESDNYVSMNLGGGPAFYSEAAGTSDFFGWKNTTVNAVQGLNTLNILVYNNPFPTGNYTGLRVNFSAINPVPEPSSMALVAGGLAALVAAVKRRNKK